MAIANYTCAFSHVNLTKNDHLHKLTLYSFQATPNLVTDLATYQCKI